jgi:hypothetical protein
VINKFNKTKSCLSSVTRDNTLQDAFLSRPVNVFFRLGSVCQTSVNVLIEILGVTTLGEFRSVAKTWRLLLDRMQEIAREDGPLIS